MHYVMLALGNDGLRFLLKDMSLTVGDQKYSSYAVTKAIHEGNEKYRNFEVDELTEHDMEAILSYAGNRGVEIIPLINTPGCNPECSNLIDRHELCIQQFCTDH